jgi:hypothetical protein
MPTSSISAQDQLSLMAFKPRPDPATALVRHDPLGLDSIQSKPVCTFFRVHSPLTSCLLAVMGKIPSTNNMVTSIITSPKPGENLPAGQTFTVSVQTKGLAAGSFTNAQATYYAAPQDLSGGGQIIGHTHLTIQDLGNSLAPTTPPDPVSFVFFKGVNDAGNGNGLLSATVTVRLRTSHQTSEVHLTQANMTY